MKLGRRCSVYWLLQLQKQLSVMQGPGKIGQLLLLCNTTKNLNIDTGLASWPVPKRPVMCGADQQNLALCRKMSAVC